MKILQINIFYGEGSTGRIVEDIHHGLLRDGDESYVVYGCGKPTTEMNVQKMTSAFWGVWYARLARLTGLRYNCAYLETERLKKHIEAIHPDVVHLHCLNNSYVNPYRLLKWLGKKNYKVLVTHHADVTITANCDHAFECNLWQTGCRRNCPALRRQLRYILGCNSRTSWKEMRRAFSKVNRLWATGVSEWMSERVKKSPFFAGRECRTILNGTDTENFTYIANTEGLRQGLKINSNEKVILHVTPNFNAEIKGGRYVVELAKRMPQVKFIVVGDGGKLPANQALKNVAFIPHTNSRREMARYYSMADITLLPSKRESFSMVTAESLSCGTPVVGFLAGAPETIAIPEYSQFVEYGNTDALQQAAEEWLAKKVNKIDLSRQAGEKYATQNMYQGYRRYYEDILSQ